jgi:hypothetical protein
MIVRPTLGASARTAAVDRELDGSATVRKRRNRSSGAGAWKNCRTASRSGSRGGPRPPILA